MIPYTRQQVLEDDIEAELYSKEAITLPLYSGLTDAMQDEVITAVKQVL